MPLLHEPSLRRLDCHPKAHLHVDSLKTSLSIFPIDNFPPLKNSILHEHFVNREKNNIYLLKMFFLLEFLFLKTKAMYHNKEFFSFYYSLMHLIYGCLLRKMDQVQMEMF